MTDKALFQIPLNGFEIESGGVGVAITFDQLCDELRKMGEMKEEEVLSQVSMSMEGVVLYFKQRGEVEDV